MRHPRHLRCKRPSHYVRATRLLLLAGVATIAAGCVERELVIDSDPDGALVYLNDQEVGRTPLRHEFMWYGTYDAVVRKDGYETVRAATPVIAPGWLWVPFDLVCEVLPFQIKDTHHLHYEMKQTAETEVDPDRLIRRGHALEQKLESGEKTVVKPLTSQPTTKPTTRHAQSRPTTTSATTTAPATQPAR